MTKKTLITLLLVLLSLDSVALGLRGINVSSHLNEPLNAEIELISSDTGNIQDIKAKLASRDAYNKAGVERLYILTKLRFQTKELPTGERVLHVTSDGLIQEPFLNFLIEVSWPQGSLVREYTILLDPPSYQPLLPVEAKPVMQEGALSRGAVVNSRYGPVKNNETLWVIAEKVRPESRLSIPQVMMGLLQHNPSAFQDENVNLLRKGVMLDIPPVAKFEQLDASTALAHFQRQTKQWRERRGNSLRDTPIKDGFLTDSPVMSKPSLDTTSPSGTSDTEKLTAQTEDAAAASDTRLRVVETGRQWQLSDTSHIVYPVADSEKLKEAIADSKQDLAAVNEINQDIEGLRIALETKVDALTLALEEKEQAIEQLRQQLDQASFASGAEGKATANTVEPTASPVVNPVDGGASVTLEKETPSSVDKKEFTDYWMTVVVVGVALFVAALILLYRFRKSPAREGEYDPFAKHAEEKPSIEVVSTSTMEYTHQEPSEKSFTVDEDTYSGSHTDTASILTEADIYLAYRRYTQAESLVFEALKHNPNHAELEAKVLEIYAFKKDKDAFVDYLEKVAEPIRQNNPDTWLKIVDMGRDLELEHGLFKGVSKSTQPDLDDSDVEPPPEDLNFDADEVLELEFLEDDYKENLSDIDELARGISGHDGQSSSANNEDDESLFLPDLDQPDDVIPSVKFDLPDDIEEEEEIPMIDIDMDEFDDIKDPEKR